MRLSLRAMPPILACVVIAGCSKPSAPIPYYALLVEAAPADGGSIELEPAPGDAGYPAGILVAVTARANGGWEFDHWEGDLSGPSRAATLTMDRARSVKALFKRQLLDEVAPAIVSTSPENRATCVSAARPVTVEFSEPMDTEATAAAVAFSPAVEGELSWNAEGTRLTFTPRGQWAAAQRYEVTIGVGAKDRGANPLVDAPRVLSFVTAGGAFQPGSLECFASWLTGVFTNDRQSRASLNTPGAAVKNIRLRARRCWASDGPAAQGYWIYVEHAVAVGSGESEELAPYRQCVHQLTRDAGGTFRSTVWVFKDRPTALAAGDFREQITDRIADAGDRAWVQTVYEQDEDETVRLVGMSRHYQMAREIILAVLRTYEGSSEPVVPTQLTPSALQARILAHIDDALLGSLDDPQHLLGTLTGAQAQALVGAMYADDPTDATMQLLRTQFEVLQPQRLRTILNAIGYNGGRNHDPQDFAGEWSKAQPLAELSPDDFEQRDGCDVTLDWDGSGAFAGATEPGACRDHTGGAVYANSELTLHEASMVWWERGFDANDQQVWGGDERYEFDKQLILPLQ